MLRPQDTATRERKSLDGLWRFAFDAEGVGRAAEWWNGPLPNAHEVAVPASYNDLFADPAARDHVGDVWYQTIVRVPAGLAGRADRPALRRRDASGGRVGERARRSPSTRAATRRSRPTSAEHVAAGEQVRVTAVVNNELSWQSIPPGFVEETEDGKHLQYYHDFFNYAGLHRSVWLYSTPVAHVSDVTVVTGLDGSAARSSTAWRPMGADGREVRVALRDAEGAEVARAAGASGVLTVADAHPWRPGEGYLYELAAELVDGDAVVDSYPVAGGHPHRGGPRHGVPDQRRAVLLHRLRPARGHPGPGQGSRRRVARARLRADGVDRRELVPDVALPVRGGGARLRRPARHRGDRRDRRGRAEHRPGGRASSAARATRRSPRRRSTTRPARSTPRRSASWWPATRTIRASCCGASPTSRNPIPRARATTSSRSSR